MEFKKALLQTNLTPSQAEILEYLYQNKEAKASEIAKKIRRSRAIVYKEIEELAKSGLVEKREKPNQIATFTAGHPSLLKKLMEEKEAQLKKDRELLFNYLPDMISSYNLINNRPGVRYYEGEEGIKIVTFDSLNSETEIYTYVDTENTIKHLHKANEEYVRKREKLVKYKKILTCDNEFTRKYMADHGQVDVSDDQLTKVKIIDHLPINLDTIMQIYDDKISYVTISKSDKIGAIIENKHITQMHRYLFEALWAKAKTLKQLLDEQRLVLPQPPSV